MEKRIEDLDISQELLGFSQIPKLMKFGFQKENILFKYNTELQHLLQPCLCMTGMGLFLWSDIINCEAEADILFIYLQYYQNYQSIFLNN